MTRLMSSLTRLIGGLLLLGFPSGDFLTGLPGCGFGLGLAFFGIGIMSAADFGHGVLQSGIWGDGCTQQGMQLDLEKEGILGTGCYTVEDYVEWE